MAQSAMRAAINAYDADTHAAGTVETDSLLPHAERGGHPTHETHAYGSAVTTSYGASLPPPRVAAGGLPMRAQRMANRTAVLQPLALAAAGLTVLACAALATVWLAHVAISKAVALALSSGGGVGGIICAVLAVTLLRPLYDAAVGAVPTLAVLAASGVSVSVAVALEVSGTTLDSTVRAAVAGLAAVGVLWAAGWVVLWWHARRLRANLCPATRAPPQTWATLAYTEYGVLWPAQRPRFLHVPHTRSLVSVGSDRPLLPGTCHLSVAGLPHARDYPLTQFEAGTAVDAAPSLRRRRDTIVGRQFSLFYDAATHDVYVQLHSAVEPIFVGFENTARFHGARHVDNTLEALSDKELEFVGPIEDTVLRALPRDLGCYCVYRHADFVHRLSQAVTQGKNPHAHVGFMTQLAVSFSDPRSLDARRTSRGEVAIRITLWEARHLLDQQLSNVQKGRHRALSHASVHSASGGDGVSVKLSSSPHLKRAHDHVTANEFNQLRKRVDGLTAQLAEATSSRYDTEAKLAAMQERHQLLRTRTRTLVEAHTDLQGEQASIERHVEVLQARCAELQEQNADAHDQLASVLDFLEERAEHDPSASDLLVALLESQGFRLSATSRRNSSAPSRATFSPVGSLTRLHAVRPSKAVPVAAAGANAGSAAGTSAAAPGGTPEEPRGETRGKTRGGAASGGEGEDRGKNRSETGRARRTEEG